MQKSVAFRLPSLSAPEPFPEGRWRRIYALAGFLLALLLAGGRLEAQGSDSLRKAKLGRLLGDTLNREVQQYGLSKTDFGDLLLKSLTEKTIDTTETLKLLPCAAFLTELKIINLMVSDSLKKPGQDLSWTCAESNTFFMRKLGQVRKKIAARGIAPEQLSIDQIVTGAKADPQAAKTGTSFYKMLIYFTDKNQAKHVLQVPMVIHSGEGWIIGETTMYLDLSADLEAIH